jgi:AcrR family transcriptional regulator
MLEKTRRRLSPDDRIEQLLDVALDLAKREGYKKLTRAMVAEAAQCSESLISAHFGDMPRFHDSLLRAAVYREVPEIVLQGLVINDPIAVAAPHDLKERAKAILQSE